MIFVICPDYTPASAGIRVLYRLVDALNAGGMAATIVHQQPGFRVTWFENNTPVVYANDIDATERDLIVISEIYGDAIVGLAPHVPKVIFNQGPYLTWNNLSPATKAYDQDNVISILTVSNDSVDYLRYCFPNKRVDRVRVGINSIFTPARTPHHSKTIAFMPRRRELEAGELLKILEQRGKLQDWTVEAIDNYSPHQTAAALRKTSIFLSFPIREGFPIPPHEAMASGCLVVGYHGRGARESFNPEWTFPIEDGDVITYAETLENIAATWDSDADKYTQMSQKAANYVANGFTEAHEAEDFVRFFADYLALVEARTSVNA